MTRAEIEARLALFKPTATAGSDTRYVNTGTRRRPLKGHPLP